MKIEPKEHRKAKLSEINLHKIVSSAGWLVARKTY